MRRLPLWLSTLVLAAACEPYGSGVHTVAVSVQHPANVAAYLEVGGADGPATGLSADAFNVYEDGQLLDRNAVGLALLPPDSVADRRTVLLVDVTGDKSARADLAKATGAFVQGAKQPVSVYAFDGTPEIRRVDPGQLASLEPKDPSRDLDGAVVKGLARLDDELAGAGRPVHVGTLVVFAAGPDLAGRTQRGALDAALDGTPYSIIAIGVGSNGKADLDHLANAGAFFATAPTTVDAAFKDATDRVAGLGSSGYVLAYCSPARSGIHEARIQVAIPGKGSVKSTADATLRFSAAGFSAGCSSHATPRFVVTVVGAHGKLAVAAAPGGEQVAAKPAESKPAPHHGNAPHGSAPAQTNKPKPKPEPSEAPPEGFEP